MREPEYSDIRLLANTYTCGCWVLLALGFVWIVVGILFVLHSIGVM